MRVRIRYDAIHANWKVETKDWWWPWWGPRFTAFDETSARVLAKRFLTSDIIKEVTHA